MKFYYNLKDCLKFSEFFFIKGDSGGPLNVLINRKWYVVGVTSYGSRSCLDGGVYSKVSAFYDWIVEKIKKN